MRYRALLEAMHEGFAVVELLRDAEGHAIDYRFTLVNPATERLVGMPHATMQGERASQLFPQGYRACLEIFSRALQTGRALRYPHDAGSVGLDYDMTAIPFGTDRCGVLYDTVTERRAAENTARAAARRRDFLLQLADATRELSDAAAFRTAAASLLGEHLNAACVLVCEIEPSQEGERVRVTAGWTGPGLAQPEESAQFDLVGPQLLRRLSQGRTLVVTDVEQERFIDAAGDAAYRSIPARAFISVPLIRDGRFAMLLTVQSIAARDWSHAETLLVEEVAKRIWATVERASAEAALRDSERRYRTLFEVMADGFVVLDMIRDEAGRPTDFRYTLANRAAARLVGLTEADVLGRTMRELNLDPEWRIELYAEAIETGRTQRFEFATPMGQVLDTTAFPYGPNTCAVLFADVTERRKAERAEREAADRQAFLLSMADALRPLDDPMQICASAARLLGEHLGVNRAFYVQVAQTPEGRVYDILPGYAAPGHRLRTGRTRAMSLAGPMYDRLDDGETVPVSDVANDVMFDAPQRERYARMSVSAMISVPLRQDGRYAAALVMHQEYPRTWTPAEVALIEDVAQRTWTTMQRGFAEQALRASETRFRDFAENSRDVLWIADAEGRTLEYLSPAFERVFGMPREAIMEQLARWSDLLHPEDRAQALSALPRTLQGETVTVQYRVVHPDGSVRVVRDTGFPILGPQGDRRWIAGIARDVTEVEQTTQAWRESEQRQRAMVAALPNIVCRCNSSGQRLIWIGPQWYDYTGQSEAEALGTGWAAALHPEDMAQAMAAWTQAAQHGVSPWIFASAGTTAPIAGFRRARCQCAT